jgi:hypothetical protein
LIGVSTDLPRSIAGISGGCSAPMPGGCGAVLGVMARGFRSSAVPTRSDRA